LDKKLGGGMLENGRAMYVFMGKPNVGKSIVLGNIAMNVLSQDKTVVLITLEMSEMVYARRIASGISNIEIGNIANKSDDLTKFLKDYKEKSGEKKLIIKEFPPKNLTVAGLSAFFEKLEKKGIRADCIILDYLNLLQSDSDDGVYFQIKEIAEHLRGMTYKYNCPLVTATQTNRGGYEGSPEMEDTSESSGLPATADVMVGIYQDDGDKEMGIMKFNIIKNRFGEAFGNFAMKLNYRNLRLEEDSQLSDGNSDSDAFSQKLKGL
jgi:replicative DNA helicase